MRDLVFAWLIVIPIAALGQTEKPASQWAKPILGYLDSLARPDGGYGWEDQPDSHLTPTFAVIGCYQLLRQDPPNKRTLAHFVRTHHPLRGENSETKQHAGELRTFVYQQIQSVLWLDEDVAPFRSEVQRWAKPSSYLRGYELHECPIFQQEMMAFVCRELLSLPIADKRI